MKKKINNKREGSSGRIITKTYHKLPFSKLSPEEFSELCYWVVDELDEFFDVEYYEGTGDKERDVIAKKKTAIGKIDKCYFQCKRYEKIHFNIFKKTIDKLKKHSDETKEFKPDIIIFVVARQVSPTIKDDTKTYANSVGFSKVFFWTDVELDKKVWDSPRCSKKFFGLGEDIESIKYLIIKKFRWETKFAFKPLLQKCPTLPNSFISRTEWVEQIDKVLSKKPFLYLYGYPKCSKTSIIAEYIANKTIDDYFWYEFKGIDSECFLFIRDIEYFIDIHRKDESLQLQFLLKKQIPVETVVQDIVDLVRNRKEFYIILDNVHLLTNKELLNFVLNSISKQENTNVKFILISETKTGFEDSSWWTNSNSLLVQGFNASEIRKLFIEEKVDISGFNENIFQFIHSNTSGHPLIVRALIEEINKSGVTPIKMITTKVLQPLKLSQNEKKLREQLQSKIYDTLLADEREKVLFNRLSALAGSFSYELVEEIAKISPLISNPLIIFNLLKRKILESKNENSYEIPSLFRKIAERSVSSSEKKDIYKVSGYFLIKPKKGVVNFTDALWGYEYLLIAEEYDKALCGFIASIHQSIEYNKLEFLNYALGFCGFLELDERKINKNLLLDFYSALATGYLFLRKNEAVERIIGKIGRISEKEKLFTQSVLFNQFGILYYGIHRFNPEKFIISIQNLFNLLKDLSEKQELENFEMELLKRGLLIAAVNAATGGIYILRILLNLAISSRINLENLFNYEKTIKYDFFETLKISLFNGFHDEILKKETDFEKVITELKYIHSKFKASKYTKGIALLSHIIGALVVAYGSEQTEARKYLNSTIKILDKLGHVIEESETYKRNATIDLADSFYIEDKFERAEKYFNEIVLEKQLDTKWDFFHFHSLRRLGICKFYTRKYLEGKGSLKKAIKYSFKYDTKYNIFGFHALGDLAVFYIKEKNYYKALQSLSLALQYIKYIPEKKYIILTGHALGWLWHTLSGKKEDSIFISKEEKWLKPEFEFFSRSYPRLDDFDFKGSIPTLYYMVGAQFKLLNKTNKAIFWFEKVLDEKPQNQSDFRMKFFLVIALSQLYLTRKNHKKALNMGFHFLDLYNNEDLPENLRKKPFSNIEDIIFGIFIPITTDLIKKKENQEFNLSEEILLNLIVRSETISIEEKNKLLAFAMATIGAFYLINNQTDEGARWLLKGYVLAEKIGYSYMIIQIEIWRDFIFTKSIESLVDLFIKNCKTTAKIIKGRPSTDSFTEHYPENFARFWQAVEIREPAKLSQIEQQLHENIKTSVNTFQNFKKTDRGFIALCFICLSGLEIVESDEVFIEISEFLLKEKLDDFSGKIPKLINLYFNKKKKMVISQLNRDANKIIKQSEEAIMILTTFLKMNNRLEKSQVDRVNVFINEFRVLTGKIL